MKVNQEDSHSSDLNKSNQMIAVIRIHGQPKLKNEIRETLDRLRMRKKLVCVLIDEKDKIKMGMLKKVKEYVAYGKIDEKMKKELESKRGETIKTGVDKGKLKPFFRLHPPRGGFKKSTKVAHPQGILGGHEDISKLLGRML